MTNEHTSLEKYTSHTLFSKGLRKGCDRVNVGYVWEVSWRRRETATYWPQVPLTIATLLPHSAGLLNRGPEGPSPLSGTGSHPRILSPTGTATRTDWLTRTDSRLELTQAVCGTWLYNCLTSTCFLWAYASAPNSAAPTGQGDIPISSTGCTCFLIDDSVEGQYATKVEINQTKLQLVYTKFKVNQGIKRNEAHSHKK